MSSGCANRLMRQSPFKETRILDAEMNGVRIGKRFT
jgi:hypothetical protein